MSNSSWRCSADGTMLSTQKESADAVPARDGRDLVHGAAGVEDEVACGQLDALFAQGLGDDRLRHRRSLRGAVKNRVQDKMRRTQQPSALECMTALSTWLP